MRPTRLFSSFPIAAAALVLAGGATSTAAQSGPVYQAADHAYRLVTVVDGLEHPWSVAFLPGGDMLVTERGGTLRRITNGRLEPQPITGVPRVWANGQGGLLDVAVHPEFESNSLVYLTYSKPSGDGATTALARGRLEGGRLAEVEDLFVADATTGRGQHFGSRLAFDGAGHLFMTIGDRGVMQQAQNRSNHQGTVVRLDLDGNVPDDNPFVGQANVRPEIWAYGIRSPQGLAFHPETGVLYETEHGPRGGDELNVIRPGDNYGWPVITWGINYNGQPIGDSLTRAPGMEQPVHYWVPSIATSGLTIYDGDRFPAWRGSAFVGGLAGAQLARVSLDGGGATGVEVLMGEYGRRVRDVRTGPDGYLYVLIDDSSAPLLRIEPAPGS